MSKIWPFTGTNLKLHNLPFHNTWVWKMHTQALFLSPRQFVPVRTTWGNRKIFRLCSISHALPGFHDQILLARLTNRDSDSVYGIFSCSVNVDICTTPTVPSARLLILCHLFKFTETICLSILTGNSFAFPNKQEIHIDLLLFLCKCLRCVCKHYYLYLLFIFSTVDCR